MKKAKITTRIRKELIRFGMHQAHMEYEITPDRIARMRTLPISSGAAYGKMKSKYFNPVYFYPKGVVLITNELGHDRDYRYILRTPKKNV